MAWFSNLSFRYKLMLPLGLLAFLLLAMAFSAMTIIKDLSETTEDVVNEDIAALNALLQADRDLYQAQVAERSMIAIDSSSKTYKSLAESHQENMQQARDRVRKFIEFAKSTKIANAQSMGPLFDAYEQLREQWENQSNQLVELYRQGGAAQRQAIEMSYGASGAAFDEMRDVLDVLTEKMLVALDEIKNETQQEATEGYTLITTLSVIAVVVCAFLAFVFPLLLTKPMRELINHVKTIAEGEGDLTVRLEEKSKDEMGQLAAAFNRFIGNLQQIISEVASSSAQVSSASYELSSVSQESLDVVTRQRNETTQVATAINEMSATVHEVANSASEAAKSADQADQQASAGNRTVKDTIKAIKELANEVEHSAQVITRLKGESENIGSVLDVIKGIAEQTNLLALNAAIEAARAGEQGRGFAVVADEVRTLAQRTQESTEEIEQMIAALQNGASEAESVMNSSRERTQTTVEQASHAEESLDAITQSVATIRDMNTQIATASEEQSAVAEEINRNVSNIHEISEESEQKAGSMQDACTELAHMGENLQSLVARFRV